MKKWEFKNPDSKIVSLKGLGEVTASNLTNEIAEELIKSNPNYESLFVQIEEKVVAEKK